jgi:hypothetical protein
LLSIERLKGETKKFKITFSLKTTTTIDHAILSKTEKNEKFTKLKRTFKKLLNFLSRLNDLEKNIKEELRS